MKAKYIILPIVVFIAIIALLVSLPILVTNTATNKETPPVKSQGFSPTSTITPTKTIRR